MTAREIQESLRTLGSPEAAAFAARYFKTGAGQYGEGISSSASAPRSCIGWPGNTRHLPLEELVVLLQSPIHEDRMLALLIMVRRFARADEPARDALYGLYLANTRFINNWDLVDASAREVVGGYLAERWREPLDRLAGSSSLWERRISIVATHHFIRRGDFADTLRIADLLLGDREDLIHKAVGWMLREVGKAQQPTLEAFLRRTAGSCRGRCCGTPSSGSRPNCGAATSTARRAIRRARVGVSFLLLRRLLADERAEGAAAALLGLEVLRAGLARRGHADRQRSSSSL